MIGTNKKAARAGRSIVLENQSDLKQILESIRAFTQSPEYAQMQGLFRGYKETMIKLDAAIRPYLPQIQMALETIQRELQTNTELKQFISMYQQLAEINFEELSAQEIEPLPCPVQPTQDIFELSQSEFTLFLSSLTATAGACSDSDARQIIFYLIILFSIYYLYTRKS